jgi:hypothetical protein
VAGQRATVRTVKRYILSRWHGETPLAVVFWRDMMVMGTLINAAATLAAILLVAIGAPTVFAVLVFLVPLPWNLFLLISVWRSAANTGGPFAFAAQLGAALWVMAATML